MAITNRSIISTCLSFKEYAACKIKYARQATKKKYDNFNAKTKEIKNPTVVRKTATGAWRAPDAIGRFILNGCFLSNGASIKSLKKYTVELTKEKIAAAAATRQKRTGSNNWPENVRAANKDKFLTHLCGLAVLIIAQNI